MSLLTKLITFRERRIEVVHETGYDVPAEQAGEICGDYAEFIRVHLAHFRGDPQPTWVKGGPGEVGAQLRYHYEYQGDVTEMTDEVVQWERDLETGATTVAWKQVHSDPPLPVRNYGCVWSITPDGADPGRCRLRWTRHFDEPMLMGMVSLAETVKRRFQQSSAPVISGYRSYFAKRYPQGPRRLPRPADRVLVVGAGPSGLHMAHLLRRRLGIENITIIEKTDRYGGKTVSEPDRTNPDYGIVHELGTCYLHPAYFAVRTLIEDIRQLPEYPAIDPAGEFGAEIEPLVYRIQSAGDNDLDLMGWVSSNLHKKPRWSLSAVLALISPTWKTEAELVTAKVRYNRLHQRLFGEYNYSMPPQLSKEAMAELDMSFGQFLEKFELSALAPILAYGQTCQGYGSIENTPAFWAMCWITPELLNGYFAVHARYPKKSMLKKGWGSLWDMIVQVNGFEIEFETEATALHYPSDDEAPVRVSTRTAGGSEREREFDYLVVAAPGIDPRQEGKRFAHLSDGWERLVGESNRDRFTHAQFRTVLFRREQPVPYLDAHLTLNADRVLGPDVGKGLVFGTRDSYLALHPEATGVDGLKNDPLREKKREQMAYQYVENGRDMDDEELEALFHDWARGEFGRPSANGAEGGYTVLKQETWTYFQRPTRQGLMERLPWRILDYQGRDRTLFVHASTFFESVLDIVNYNNMVVSGLGGDLNVVGPLKDDPKPYDDQSDHWQLLYNNPVVRGTLTLLSWTLTVVWTALYVVVRPLVSYNLIRWQRKHFQAAFHTKDLGPWWKFGMSHFLKVSPSVISMLAKEPDPIMADEPSKTERETFFPDIPKVPWALRLNYRDYRDTVRIWQKHSDSTYLRFLSLPWMLIVLPVVLALYVLLFRWLGLGVRFAVLGALLGVGSVAFVHFARKVVGRTLGDVARLLAADMPILYNYLFSWTVAVGFNSLTGYGFRREDSRGGGYYIPACHMLRAARREYGEEMGMRYCTHVCKIFTEEYLASVGLPCVLEPDHESKRGSCWMRGAPERAPAISDHTTAWYMDPPERLVQIVRKERAAAG